MGGLQKIVFFHLLIINHPISQTWNGHSSSAWLKYEQICSKTTRPYELKLF